MGIICWRLQIVCEEFKEIETGENSATLVSIWSAAKNNGKQKAHAGWTEAVEQIHLEQFSGSI